jgi:cell division transport system permease protein
MNELPDVFDRIARRTGGPAPRPEAPIVPKTSIAGSALIAVVAIMAFLGALTTGAVLLVAGSANEWQSDVAREMTIQVRPQSGRDIEADVTKAAEIARATPGVAEVRPYTKAESARLLEPWLGSGLTLDELPVPRVIIVRLQSSTAQDFDALRASLARDVPNASLDDHRGWISRMRAMAGTAIAIGIAILLIVLAATVLTVSFATRGAMAANQTTIEVLHFIGATDGYIAEQFQRHFLTLGLKGGGIGGGAAVLIFIIAGLVGDRIVGTASGDEISALFGSFSIGFFGYMAIAVQIAVIAAITAGTSRRVVTHTLTMVA